MFDRAILLFASSLLFLIAAIPSIAGECYKVSAHVVDSPVTNTCDCVWGITVLLSFCIVLACYVVAAVFAKRAADGLTIVYAERRQALLLVRRRALLTGGGYLACFLFMYAPQAVESTFFSDAPLNFGDALGTVFFLSGAANVVLMLCLNSNSHSAPMHATEYGEADSSRSLVETMQHFDLRKPPSLDLRLGIPFSGDSVQLPPLSFDY